jgi:putative cardiolipin synthase
MEAIRRDVANTLEGYREVLSAYPLQPRQWHDKLLSLPAHMKRGEAHFLQDEPVRFGQEELRLVNMLQKLTQPSHTELIIVSPYLIPEPMLLDRMEQLASEGVHIRVLTPSMGSNNHTIVHSHYKKYRRRLLARGELYEFKHSPSPALRAESDVSPVQARFISLHVKAGVGDRQRCFIGSLNLDPRAVRINTENGLYIESPELSRELADYLETLMAPENAWRVTSNKKNKLSWESDAGIVTRQPARSFSQRVSDFFYRLLPIENQL